MKSYDVLLINPPTNIIKDKYEQLGIGYLAAVLRKENIDVKIIDVPIMDMSTKNVLNIIKYTDPKIIGITIPFQDSAKEAFDFINEIRKEDFNGHISVGGIYPTFSYEEIMTLYPSIDSIVIGEGEVTFLELVKKILDMKDWRDTKGIAYNKNGKIIRNDDRPLIEDLDSIPFTARDTLPMVLERSGVSSILSSRGCYGRCSFCSVGPFFSQFGAKYRLRSCENVLDEIDMLYYKYNVKNLFFNDAEFIGGKGKGYERAYNLSENIIKKKYDLRFSIQCRVNDVDEELFTVLKKAGLRRVFLGVESGSQSILDRFNKDVTVGDNIKALKILNKLGLYISMGFIMFDPEINFKELSENIEFIRNAKALIPKKRFDYYPLSRLLPLAGTLCEKRMKETNRYKGNSLKYDYTFDDPSINILYKTSKSLFATFGNIGKIMRRNTDIDKEWMKR